jgi:hypothetical protein
MQHEDILQLSCHIWHHSQGNKTIGNIMAKIEGLDRPEVLPATLPSGETNC